MTDYDCSKHVSKSFCWGCERKQLCSIYPAYKKGLKEAETVEVEKVVKLNDEETVDAFARMLKKQISPNIVSHLIIDYVADQMKGQKNE